jgi:hypothetical protein
MRTQASEHNVMTSGGNASVWPVQLAIAGVLGLSSLTFSAAANQAEMQLRVSATVLKRASVQVISQPAAVTVSADDLVRGYVDVPAPAQLAIKSNSPSGYLLEFANQGDFMSQILVTGLASNLQFGPDGGVVAQPGNSNGVTRATLNLGFRFLLSASAQPGIYAWPIRLSVAAL